MSLATIVQKYVFRKPVDTGRYTGRTGGKAGFHPAFLSSVLHGGSQICWHLCRWTRRQLKSLGFQMGVHSRWHCCFSSPASVSFSPFVGSHRHNFPSNPLSFCGILPHFLWLAPSTLKCDSSVPGSLRVIITWAALLLPYSLLASTPTPSICFM